MQPQPPDEPTRPSAPPAAPPPTPTVAPLPPRLADPTLPTLVGTVLWFLASAALFAVYLAGGRTLDGLFWACTAGWVLGLLGYALFRWQRSAARRGSRAAQSGLAPPL